MDEYVGCRKCDSPDCKGCNLKNLETMLNNGKFDCLMNGNLCINPSADVAPVRHGRWEKAQDMRRMDGNIYDFRCSRCNAFAEKGLYNNYDRLTNYCPNCGAKMDLEVS